MIFAIQWNFHLTDKIENFLRNKDFLLIPRGLCSIIGTLRSIVQHVFASVAARQIRVFILKIAHIVHSLYNSTKRIFIVMVAKDLNAFLTFVHAAENAN